MNATDRLTVAAPAKVNLFLHVTGQRPDGYHLIESLFALIDFADFVSLECRHDGAILRAHDLPGIDATEDLTLRAATLLKSATGIDKGVAISVDKRIPQGGGLGGGSSDAASVLVALNRLWGCGLPRDELAGLGAKVGALARQAAFDFFPPPCQRLDPPEPLCLLLGSGDSLQAERGEVARQRL